MTVAGAPGMMTRSGSVWESAGCHQAAKRKRTPQWCPPAPVLQTYWWRWSWTCTCASSRGSAWSWRCAWLRLLLHAPTETMQVAAAVQCNVSARKHLHNTGAQPTAAAASFAHHAPANSANLISADLAHIPPPSLHPGSCPTCWSCTTPCWRSRASRHTAAASSTCPRLRPCFPDRRDTCLEVSCPRRLPHRHPGPAPAQCNAAVLPMLAMFVLRIQCYTDAPSGQDDRATSAAEAAAAHWLDTASRRTAAAAHWLVVDMASRRTAAP